MAAISWSVSSKSNTSRFSASRSRRLSIVPIIQSIGQLEKNYGKEGSAIIIDNCQDILFGGFAPNSESADILSRALGNKTVMSGSISRGKNDPSQSLQMIQRPLMTPDELKTLSKGNFILAKTGCYTMRQLAVNGADLMDIGIPAGPGVGATLQTLLNDVMEGTLPNEREALLAAAVK